MGIVIDITDEIAIENHGNDRIHAIFKPTKRAFFWCERDPFVDVRFGFFCKDGTLITETCIERAEAEFARLASIVLESPGVRQSESCTVPAYCPKCMTDMVFNVKSRTWHCGAYCEVSP